LNTHWLLIDVIDRVSQYFVLQTCRVHQVERTMYCTIESMSAQTRMLYFNTWLDVSVESFHRVAVDEGYLIGGYSNDWTVFFMDGEDISVPVSTEIADILPDMCKLGKERAGDRRERMKRDTIDGD
jgi:hypothetical protein